MATVKLNPDFGLTEEELAKARAARGMQGASNASVPAQSPLAPVSPATPVESTPAQPAFGSREFYQEQGKKANSDLESFKAHLSSMPALETPQYDALDKNAPQQSNYQFNQDFMSKYLEKPLSEEELARRERAAYASDGVLNFGNALGALGNLAFVAGGAAPQKLPTVPDTDAKVNAMRDRADRVRQAYINGILAGRQADRNEFAQDRSFNFELNKGNNALKQQGFNDARGVRQDELQRQGALAGIAQHQAGQAQQGLAQQDRNDQWEKQFKENQRQFNANYALQKKAQEFDQQYKTASLTLKGLQGGIGGNGKNSIPASGVMLLEQGKNGMKDTFGTVDNGKLMQGYYLMALRDKLPESTVNKEGKKVGLREDFDSILKDKNLQKDPTKLYQAMSRFVSRAAVQDDNARKYLVDSGVVQVNPNSGGADPLDLTGDLYGNGDADGTIDLTDKLYGNSASRTGVDWTKPQWK